MYIHVYIYIYFLQIRNHSPIFPLQPPSNRCDIHRYWGTSASHAQLSLEKLGFHERLKRQAGQMPGRSSYFGCNPNHDVSHEYSGKLIDKISITRYPLRDIQGKKRIFKDVQSVEFAQGVLNCCRHFWVFVEPWREFFLPTQLSRYWCLARSNTRASANFNPDPRKLRSGLKNAVQQVQQACVLESLSLGVWSPDPLTFGNCKPNQQPKNVFTPITSNNIQ